MSETVDWSYTSSNIMRQCQLKFGFSHLLASHGRKDALRRKAYELKQMQTLKMWVGSVVDKFMEKVVIPAIVAKQDLYFDALAEQAVQMAENQFRFSKLGAYKDASLKKSDADDSFCILDIHEISASYTEEELLNCYVTIREAILKLPLIRMPNEKLLINYLKEANSLRANVNDWLAYIEKARLKPQMDLLGLHNWKPVVMDWKLSASHTSDYSRQLIACGITVYLKRMESGKTPYRYEEIKLYEVNLLKNEVKEHEFTAAAAGELINYINLTSSDMHLLSRKENGIISLGDFDLTDDEGLCRLCNFQPLCSYLINNNYQYDEKSYIKSLQDKQPA